MQTLGDVLFSKFCEGDIPDGIHLLANDLYPRERLSVDFQVSYEDDKDNISKGILGWVNNGVSVVARDQKSGRLIGLVFSSIQCRGQSNSFQDEINHVNPKVRALYSLLHTIEAKVDFFTIYAKLNRILRIENLSVAKEFCGRGIGTRLIQESETRGLELRCQLAATQATSMASQRAFSSRGYTVFGTMDCATSNFSNKETVTGQQTVGSTCVHMMARVLQTLD